MRVSKLLKETKVLFLIGLVDLLLTLILFNLFGFDAGIEKNGIFRAVLSRSPMAFALVKTAGLLLCLGFIEFLRRRAEGTAKKYLKTGIAVYVGLWVILVIKTNILPLF